MELLQNLTVTGNLEVVTVRQIKGTGAEIKNRPSYGLSFCYDGQITYTLDGVDYISDPDCAIILPKGATYSLRKVPTSTSGNKCLSTLPFTFNGISLIETTNDGTIYSGLHCFI